MKSLSSATVPQPWASRPPAGPCSTSTFSMDSAFTSVGGPAPDSARQGRHRQRYALAGERLVAGWVSGALQRLAGAHGAQGFL